METLTEQERQLIECIRRLKDPDEFSITVALENGAWEINMSASRPGKVVRGRGVGSTFGAAWDSVTGLQF